jgi:hypothetical protein
MKNINEKFTDLEHAALVRAKGDKNWHDFIMDLLKLEVVRDLIDGAEVFEAVDGGSCYAVPTATLLEVLDE